MMNRLVALFPYAMFLLVPVFALLTRMIYPNRPYNYGEHLVFALHYHAAVFLVGAVVEPFREPMALDHPFDDLPGARDAAGLRRAPMGLDPARVLRLRRLLRPDRREHDGHRDGLGPPMNMYESSIKSLPLVGRGKVRDIYAVGDDKLLIVTTDRLSAYDVVMPTPIPEKGRVLTRLADFWFGKLAHIVPNHLTGIDPETVVAPQEREQVRGRSIVVKRMQPLPIEAVVRGYLEGSGWVEYQASGTVCGIALPPGLQRASKLPQPIFTPATKAEAGHHDENIDVRARGEDGRAASARPRCATPRSASTRPRPPTRSSAASSSPTPSSSSASTTAGRLVLIDEALTPDSSRFWPLDTWRVGASPESFDKQYVRNWLDSIGFARKPPAPEMPPDVARRTSEKYQEALRRLMG